MTRRTNAALRVGGIVLALSGLGGLLAGCGDSDEGAPGASRDAPQTASSDASQDASEGGVTKAGFCDKMNALGPAVSTTGSTDAAAFARLEAWIADMEDYGTPSELSDDEGHGVAILIALFRQVDESTSQADFQNLGKDLSKGDQKDLDAFSAWANENCVVSSSDASPTADPSGDAS